MEEARAAAVVAGGQHTAVRHGRIAGTTTHRMQATRATTEAGAATTGAAPVQDSRPATDSQAAVAAGGRGRSTAAAVSMAGRTTAAAGTADSPNSQRTASLSTALQCLRILFSHYSGIQYIPVSPAVWVLSPVWAPRGLHRALFMNSVSHGKIWTENAASPLNKPCFAKECMLGGYLSRNLSPPPTTSLPPNCQLEPITFCLRIGQLGGRGWGGVT